MRERHGIKDSWSFKKATYPDSAFTPVAGFPTNIHLDLLAAGLIPDPFIGVNENNTRVQAVADADWTYRTTFRTPPSVTNLSNHAFLVFEGLDTIAHVELNGYPILDTNNMFLQYPVDVTDRLHPPCPKGGFFMVASATSGRMPDENELVITFKSAQKYGEQEMLENPDHKWLCSNGNPARLAVRKAQYHWGWDWGPTLTTCGPWKPVVLDVFEARIGDLWARGLFDDPAFNSRDAFVDLESLYVSIEYSLQGAADELRLVLSAPDGQSSFVTVAPIGAFLGESDWHWQRPQHATVRVDNPQLWYPARYGSQAMYTLTATLIGGSPRTVLDIRSTRVGFRHVRLVQDSCRDGLGGTTFFFEVNGIPVFCGGSNWIPADSFLPRLTPEKYRTWVGLASAGNQTMLRVWGGGVYEDDAFYDACDEAGILVWQDFMFACGNYPATDRFLKLVGDEASQIVRRLGQHPCIALWAGNNEDYQIAEANHLDYDPNDKNPENWLSSTFPARYIYEELIKKICAQFTPGIPYHPGSPWGGAGANNPTIGDVHQWSVWHGAQLPYQDYAQVPGRFVSEFGMQAMPCVQTTTSYLANDASQCWPSSAVVDFHNKAAGHDRRLGSYLLENVGFPGKTLEDVTYTTQLIQAEAMSSAIGAWRQKWSERGRDCGGALIWQFNDCWPCTSWAICDYYLRPKPAYFVVKRELADVSAAHPPDCVSYAVSASNLTLTEKRVVLKVLACNVETGDLVPLVGGAANPPQTHPRTVILPPNSSTVLHEKYRTRDREDSDHLVVWATLVDPAAEPDYPDRPAEIARHVLWPQPLKYIPFRDPGIEAVFFGHADSPALMLRATRPAKGVWIEAEGVDFQDNFVDLVPDWTIVGTWAVAPPGGAWEVTRPERFKMTYFGAPMGGNAPPVAGVQSVWMKGNVG